MTEQAHYWSLAGWMVLALVLSLVMGNPVLIGISILGVIAGLWVAIMGSTPPAAKGSKQWKKEELAWVARERQEMREHFRKEVPADQQYFLASWEGTFDQLETKIRRTPDESLDRR